MQCFLKTISSSGQIGRQGRKDKLIISCIQIRISDSYFQRVHLPHS